MTKFQERLRKQQQRFNRKVRKFVLICSITLFLLALGTITIFRYGDFWEGSDVETRIDASLDISDFTMVPTGDPDDPSQLVLPGLIAPDAVGETVIREGVQFTPIDIDVLENIIQTVQSVPQDELKMRVDESIKWEDFNDANRRNQIMGRVCSFRGTLRRKEKNDNVDFPDLEIDHLYEGQIQDAMDRWYSFYIFEEPERPIERFDVTEITGVFYKLITYPSRGGGEMVTPLIIGRTLESEREHFAYRGRTQSFARTAPAWLFYPVLIGIPALICLFIHKWLKEKSSIRRKPKKFL